MTDIPPLPFVGQNAPAILSRMLDAVDDSMVKVEGDVVHDMLAPAAQEIERVYMDLEVGLAQVFPTTATGDNLTALALNRGLTRATDETDDELRARLLAFLATPDGAGSVADYRRWVSDVTAAGPIQVVNEGDGDLTVYVRYADMADADAPLLADVQAVLDARSPATATPTAAAATQTAAAFSLSLTAMSAAQQSTWEDAIAAWFRNLAPGDDFNIYTLLAAAGISPSVYVSHVLNGSGAASQTRSDGQTWRITGITLAA